MRSVGANPITTVGVSWGVAAMLLCNQAGATAQPPTTATGKGVVAAAQQHLSSAAPGDVHLSAACGSDGPYREVRVFGSGVGLWNRAAQFAAPKELLESLLAAFREAEFDGMPVVFGGTVAPAPVHRGPRVICQVSLTVGPLSKEVIQLEKGAQSKALLTLAHAILDLSETRAASGTTASSLEDGLAMIAAGQLAPEALDLTIHHRPDRNGSRGASGWILHVDGGAATADDYGDDASSRKRVSLRLATSELIDLVRTLQAEAVAALPGNVYFADYTDVHLEVLGREHQVQARQFSGMTTDIQARGRAQLERLLAAFTALHRRVIERGQPMK